jgi:hypothetical protein
VARHVATNLRAPLEGEEAPGARNWSLRYSAGPDEISEGGSVWKRTDNHTWALVLDGYIECGLSYPQKATTNYYQVQGAKNVSRWTAPCVYLDGSLAANEQVFEWFTPAFFQQNFYHPESRHWWQFIQVRVWSGNFTLGNHSVVPVNAPRLTLMSTYSQMPQQMGYWAADVIEYSDYGSQGFLSSDTNTYGFVAPSSPWFEGGWKYWSGMEVGADLWGYGWLPVRAEDVRFSIGIVHCEYPNEIHEVLGVQRWLLFEREWFWERCAGGFPLGPPVLASG